MSKRLSWAVRIDRAGERGYFTTAEHRLARSWLTCAVGEKNGFPRNPEEDSGPEEDRVLYSLGLDFASAVACDDQGRARQFYKEIMARP